MIEYVCFLFSLNSVASIYSDQDVFSKEESSSCASSSGQSVFSDLMIPKLKTLNPTMSLRLSGSFFRTSQLFPMDSRGVLFNSFETT